jgi:hypothetical protein
MQALRWLVFSAAWACAAPPRAPERRPEPPLPAYVALQTRDRAELAITSSGEEARFGGALSRLEGRLGAAAVEIRPLHEPEASFSLQLRTLTAGGEAIPLASEAPQVRGATASLRRGPWVEEWFRHGELGVQHGFHLARRLGPPGEVAIDLALSGPGAARWVVEDGAAVLFGARVPSRYGGLDVRDADGRALPSRLEATADGLRISFDDRGARYPIEVDPLIAVGQVILTDPTPATARFGEAIGLDVGVVAVGDPGSYGEGRVHVFHGELGEWALFDSLESQADPSLHDGYGPDDLQNFGATVAAAGGAVVVGVPSKGFFQVHESFGLAYGLTDIYFYQDRPSRCGDRVLATEGRVAYGCPYLNTDTVPGLMQPYGQGVFFIRNYALNDWQDAGMAYAGVPFATGWGEEAAMAGGLLVVGMTYPEEDNSVHEWDGSRYIRKQSLPAPIGDAPWLLGEQVATDGERIAAVYYDQDRYWVQVHGRAAPAFPFGATARFPLPEDAWAADLAIDGDTIAVGDGAHEGGLGGVLLYREGPEGWTWQSTVMSSDPQPGEGLGVKIELKDGLLLAASDTPGRVHLFAVDVLGEPDGTPCEEDTDCEGFCVDGLCCDTVCGGDRADDCLVCSAALGAVADGDCTPLADATTCHAGACRGGACLPPCGDDICDGELGENCQNCADDCGACCGNGTCDGLLGEDCASCEEDCGACCGNGQVETGEFCDGGDLAGMDCGGLGEEEGVLRCADDCTFDTRGCGAEPGDTGDSGDTDPPDVCTETEAWGLDLGDTESFSVSKKWEIGIPGAKTSLEISADVAPTAPAEDRCTTGVDIGATAKVCIELGSEDCYAIGLEASGGCEAARSCTNPPVATCSGSAWCCEDEVALTYSQSKEYSWPTDKVAKYTGDIASMEIKGELGFEVEGSLGHQRGTTCAWSACQGSGEQVERSGTLAVRGTAAGAAALKLQLFGSRQQVSASTSGCVELSGEVSHCEGGGTELSPDGGVSLDASVGQIEIGWFKMSPQSWELVRFPDDFGGCE